LRDVSSQGQSGKHILGLSFSVVDPYATYAPRPVLVELGLKNGSLDKPAQSELGSA
jgi:hypothetical protein